MAKKATSKVPQYSLTCNTQDWSTGIGSLSLQLIQSALSCHSFNSKLCDSLFWRDMFSSCKTPISGTYTWCAQ